MSYAYYQGQEAQALDYYKKLLASESDPSERAKIASLVDELEKILAAQSAVAPNSKAEIHHALNYSV
jgi:hypothetical protein